MESEVAGVTKQAGRPEKRSRLIRAGGPFRYAALNKPSGCLCARKPPNGKDTPTVYDVLKCCGFPLDMGHVGRLDRETEGLLLFTDDGLLLQALTNSHPVTRNGSLPHWAKPRMVDHTRVDGDAGPDVDASQLTNETGNVNRNNGRPTYDKIQGITKKYICELDGPPPTEAQLELMRQPFTYGEGKGSQKQGKQKVVTGPAEVHVLGKSANGGSLVEVCIAEGRNRQVRRLVKRSRLQLRLLRRVALGPIELHDLPTGRARWLCTTEIAACYALALPGHQVPDIVQNTP